MENPTPKQDWLVVVNPNAGRKKGRKDWKLISSLFSKYSILFKSEFTEAKRHAIEITRSEIQSGYRKILVVGGDGTMNEVVNGIYSQDTCPTSDIYLGMISVGTGNDWGRMFGIPNAYEEAIKIIKTGRIILQDSGVVHYYSGTTLKNRYFINIAGLGFDAVVVKRSNKQKDKGKSGKALYMINLLSSLIGYKSTDTEVVIDGSIVRHDTFSISLGIGRYSGGGMIQTPNAIPDDGLFDITIIKKMRYGEIIRSLKKLYDGTILDHPKIESFTGKDIKIDSDPLIHVEADGESLGHSPIEFEIIPKSIKVICGTCANE